MAYVDAKTDVLPGSEFRIGRVISKSLDVFVSNIVTFTLIAGVVWLPFLVFAAIQEPALGPQGGPPSAPQIAEGLVSFALFLFLTPLSTAIILHGAFQYMRGRPVRMGESVSVGLSRLLPLLGVIVLITLGAMVGTLLLVIPGVILLLMWYVAVPVCVVEKMGPVRSLGRSRQLTKGCRWKLFGLMLLVGIVGGVGKVVVTFAGSALAGDWGAVGTQFVWQGLAGGFNGVLGVVTYYYLRVAKEGVDVDQIAAVFD
jgi:hypothetical protein